jgi:membrane protein
MTDSRDPPPIEIEIEPTPAGRLARAVQRGRILHGRVEASRSRHASVDLGFDLVERDSAIGGGLLAGALAYRLFVLLLPTTLLLVAGLGLYAGTVDKSTGAVAKEAGLHGLVASQVASTAAGHARGIVFLVMIPAVLYSAATLFRSIAKVHGIVWQGSGRGVRMTSRGFAVFMAALIVQLVAVTVMSRLRREGTDIGLAAFVFYAGVVAACWLAVSLQMPHRDARWTALVPGSVLFGVGLLAVNVFNVYVTARLVENRADTYGALGVATALLFSLVLVGRVMVVSAGLNAAFHERRRKTEI